jgi:hypothetical protein
MPHRNLQWITLMVSLAWGLASVGGCSDNRPKTAPVRGKITYKGNPVRTGTIMFEPDQVGPAAVGDIQRDGAYTLKTYKPGDGAILGMHRVTITALEDQSGKLPEQRNPLPALLIPLKYAQATTSGLRVEVQHQDNVINFDLD